MIDFDCDVAILGAGPGGMSAAARAAQRGMSHVLLEAAEQHAHTIQSYQRGKHIMAEPSRLPLRSDIGFEPGKREDILDHWRNGIERAGVKVRYRAEVVEVVRLQDAFRVALKSGEVLRARFVIVALGIQGNPRRLGVAGEDHPCIQTALECADDHHEETIMVVGAGDSAIETALALARGNRLILVNRGAGFARAKERNAARINKAIEAKALECHSESAVVRVEDAPGNGAPRCRVVLRTPQGECVHLCDRVIARLGAEPPRRFIEPIGVRYLSAGASALPDLSVRYESSVPGLFIIGALAGYPLIKQALNQGYEVIEHLLGNAVEPADQPVLAAKLRAVPFGEDVDSILAQLGERVRLLDGVGALTLRELVAASRVRVLEAGSEIFLRGDYLASVFNVVQGEVHLYRPEGASLPIATGEVFGAMSAMSGRPCETTAIAGRDCVLLETPHTEIRKLLRAERSAQAYVDRVYIGRALNFLLTSSSGSEAIPHLAESARFHHVKAGEALFSEGDVVDRIYIVRRGSVTLSRHVADREVVVSYCGAGGVVDSVGELSGQARRTVTARATVATEALSLDHDIFVRELAGDAALRQQIQSQRAAELEQYARMNARPEAGNVVSFLMSHGVGEATSVLVIDEALCVGCDQCEKACAATHEGVSRLNRRAGPSFNSLHVPTSCRHCEHPHCMSDCPADAIHRRPNGEVFIDDTCIGCGNCEENCPYGVIQMAEMPVSVSLLDRLRRRPQPEAAKVAVKCDMCIGVKAGPACVNACPTGAAIRIHASDVVRLAQKRVANG